MEKDNFLDEIKVEGTDPKKALLRTQIIAFLTGERMLNEILEENRKQCNGLPIEGKTFRNRIKEFIENGDKDIENLYKEHKEKRNVGVDYTIYIIKMLLNDWSQRETAEICGINRNSFKEAIKKVEDPRLKRIIQEHASVHKRGRNCPRFTVYEDAKWLGGLLNALEKKEKTNKENGNKEGKEC